MDKPLVLESRLLGHRPLQLLLLTVAMAAAGYARTALSPVQEALRVAMSLSDNQMALLQGPVIGIPVVITAVPLGLMIDRYSRARLLVIMIALSLFGSLLTALASSFPELLVTRGLTGLTAMSVVPIVFSLVSDLCPVTTRGRATTAVIIGQVVGNSAVFALGGELLELADPASDAWRHVMLYLSIPFALMALVLLAFREPQRTDVGLINPSLRQVWVELKEYRVLISCLTVGVVLMETAVGAMLTWAGPMLARTFSLHPGRVGTVMAAGMLVSGIAGPALGGILADICQRKGGSRRTLSMLSALAFLSAPAGLFAFVPCVSYASILLIVAMTLMLGVAVMGITLFTVVIPNELRGICISVLMAGDMLFSFAVAPPLVSALSAAMGGMTMIGYALSTLCLIASALTTVTFALGWRYGLRRVTHEASEYMAKESTG